MCRKLLAAGADATLTDADGNTPEQVACSDVRWVTLLSSHDGNCFRALTCTESNAQVAEKTKRGLTAGYLRFHLQLPVFLRRCAFVE